MIEITLYKENDKIVEYKVEGHSKDKRICAIVSVVTQSPIMTILDKFEIGEGEFDYSIGDEGYLYVKLPFNNTVTDVLMEHMRLTLREIEKQYKKDLIIMEVIR